MKKNKNIILCGYMASGKSTVGKVLADKLHLKYIDLDKEIERKIQLPIPEIFEEMGEIFFRKKESEVLKEILQEKDKVISLGGGTPVYGNNLGLIKSDRENILVYLKVNLEILTGRLWNEKNKRPLLSFLNHREDLEEYIRKHMFERNFYYLQSNLIIETNSLLPEEIADEIIKNLK
ncbi:shikimate kinase [Mesonia sp. K7]|uniref:shikimate kinase n=1 Tax=Mesonia sp. K7 TaxID=2218606 RepID=UPI000DA7A8D2|nr:shikimate kinase [Mesonia sp. K7]PZD77868.1 shikimate kinase [Mesonia sp. K7]